MDTKAEFDLLDRDAIVEEDDTFNITGYFWDDEDNSQLTKAQLSSATVEVRNSVDQSVIAAERSIMDSIDTDGNLVLKTLATDNPNVATSVGALERHDYLFAWSWVDSDDVPRTKKVGVSVLVRPWNDPA